MEVSIFLITCGDNLKLRRLLFGMRQLFIHGGLAAAWVLGGVLPAADGSFDLARLEREVVVAAADDPVALDFGPSGSIFFVERTGTVKKWEATTGGVSVVGRVPSLTKADAGALGFVLARDFATSGHFFLLYVPEPRLADRPHELRVSRFSVRDGRLVDGSEAVLLAIPLEGGDSPAHCGGGLAWDAAGNLLIGIGDNSPPQDLPAVHPDELPRDSRRSAANSQDLRGKILRITPAADGTYTIPQGNMFADRSVGRPEVWLMGARNPFRIAVDAQTGRVVWGDVGGNVDPALDLGPEGYDELNVTSAPGFYGWPFCSGPNEPWRSFDGATRRARGPFFDPLHVVNESKGNTGLVSLPPSQPALLWYPTSESREWPQLGSGGRSITSGPVYRYDAYPNSTVRLPESLDGAILWGEWMRNFLAVARVAADGTLQSVERLMPDTIFRKPSDLRLGPDGALYIAEYGDAWAGNTTGQITRVLYRRGHRAPIAQASASVIAGPAPLSVTFDAGGSSDPDAGDREALTFSWKFDGATGATGATATHVFSETGRFPVELTVRDPHGLEARSTVVIAVGNTPPVVRITQPADGSFFEYDRPVAYQVEAVDAEDGVLGPEKVLVQYERRDRLRSEDEATVHPGLALMRAGTCFACHRAAEASAGPAYVEVARRHAPDVAAREKLTHKILQGGVGAWGAVPMPPHPQHTAEQAGLMVDWILAQAEHDARALSAGLQGTLTVPAPQNEWGAFANGVVILTAAATDGGTPAAAPLSAENRLVLRTRRQMAAAFDRAVQTTTQHTFEHGVIARMQAGGWIAFDQIPLATVRAIRLRLHPVIGDAAARLEVRSGSPDSPLIGQSEIPAAKGSENKPLDLQIPLPPPPSVPSAALTTVFFRLAGAASGTVDLVWIEFQ